MATVIYSYSGSATAATQYGARNQMFLDFFNDIIATPPTGFAYVSSTLPAVSTGAYLLYTARFSYGDILVDISSYSGSSNNMALKIDLLTSSGASIIASNTPYAVSSSSGAYTFAMDLSLSLYFLANTYNIIRLATAYNNANYSFGMIYLIDKASYAEDYVIYSDFNTTAFLFTKYAAQFSLFGNNELVGLETGEYFLIDAHLYASATYYGRIKNAKVVRKASTRSINIGAFYVVGRIRYLSISQGNNLLVAVS